MGLFDFYYIKKDNSSQEFITFTNEWVAKFLRNAPTLQQTTYNKDEIYMFCAWIVMDWTKNTSYFNENSDLNDFFETIFNAVRNTGTYQQSEMEQFMFRVNQYQHEIKGMLECDYPRTRMFFPKTLFARLTNLDFDNPPFPYIREQNLMTFTNYIGSFWNDINREIMKKFPRKNKF